MRRSLEEARVLVADVAPLWREICAQVLTRAGHQVVAQASTVEELERLSGLHRPDVVISDVWLDADALPAIYAVSAQPGTEVLVLSSRDGQADLSAAIRAGATGYLLRTATREELVDAVDTLAAGEQYVPPQMASMMLAELRRAMRRPKKISGEELLTPREAQVLRLVGTGLTYQQIARELALSVRTVTNHAQHVMNKLGLHSRVDMALHAREHGHVEP